MAKMKGLISFVGLKFEAYEKKGLFQFQMEMRQREQRWLDKKDDKDLPFSIRYVRWLVRAIVQT